ncbi:probable stress-associated endoplasmic reticulum protein [Telopea speciosissima]|uniref:probable stress-associated endoplasmic reticulum protein n=1 Tax=Telopea speciosissima TaxID=54955 RepID=UPI001CC3EE1D|nr:probable stress-associated endoplasmic reticulum protein [Telopea speciosissima]
MTTSRRFVDRKVERFEENISKRGGGGVPKAITKKGNNYPVGPLVLGFFLFVVIGSSLFQIIRRAASGGMAWHEHIFIYLYIARHGFNIVS